MKVINYIREIRQKKGNSNKNGWGFTSYEPNYKCNWKEPV